MTEGREFAGWGRVRRTRSTVAGDADAVRAALAAPAGLIVHGGGRSYGDAALNDGGAVLLTSGLNRVLSFDAETGAIEVQPGVTFAQLLDVFLPLGFLVPVSPGTGFATVGGAVAMDVHGKNHEHAGSFGQHVMALDLTTPDGATHTIGPERETDLFRATCGGIGLTGVIGRVAFRMQRVAGNAVAVREQRVGDLEAFLEAMSRNAGASYSVGWIDGTARGPRLGRGILFTGEPVTEAVRQGGRRFEVPFDFPGFVLNPWSVAAFNAWYFRRVPAAGRTRFRSFRSFLYPLDSVGGWNRIYGRRGFHQFQAVVPFEDGEASLRALLEEAAASRRASFLAVLKRMGPGRAGYLSFPMAGYTLALDFPAGAGVEDLYARLVRTVRRVGGRVYLAKDGLMTGEDLRGMYGEVGAFEDVVRGVGAGGRMGSDMARRLGLVRAISLQVDFQPR